MIQFIGNGKSESYDFIRENVELTLKFCRQNDISVEELQLLPRTRNVLKLNRICKVSDLVALEDSQLDSLEFASEQAMNEIRMLIGEYIDDNLDRLREYISNSAKIGGSASEQTGFPQTDADINKAKCLLSDEAHRGAVIEALQTINLDLPVENLKLSPRVFNCAKRAGKNFVSELMDIYPDGYINMRNSGNKTADELRGVVERFIADNLVPITAVLNGEDALEYMNTPGSEGKRQTFEDNIGGNSGALCIPEYKPIIIEYFKKHDIPVEDLGLSVRSYNCLKRARADTLSKIIRLYPNGFISLKNIGTKTVSELKVLVETVVERNKNRIFNPDEAGVIAAEPVYTDEYITDCLLGGYDGDNHFAGLNFDQLRGLCPENVEEKQLKHVIGSLIHENKLEYVDFRCYRVYPHIMEYVETAGILKDREKEIFKLRAEGKTLEETGAQFGITRERVRQLAGKATKKIRNSVRATAKAAVFDEDYYEYFYATYEVPEEFWADYSGISKETKGYLSAVYKAGKKDIAEAIEDDGLSVGLRLRIQEYLDRDCIVLDGVKIPGKRKDIQDYIVSVYCRDDTEYEEFVKLYNKILEDNNIPFDEKLYISDSAKRSRMARVEESRICLWKYGGRFRYYDIDSNDYTELLDTLNLGGFSNTEISTLKFFEDFPDVMRKYDIRDQYELHNLLRKTLDVSDYPGMSVGPQPMLKFGEFDRETEIRKIIETFSPVSVEELTDYLHSEFGYRKDTILGTYLSPFAKYCDKDIYDITACGMQEARRQKFLSSLTDNFYVIRSLKGQYRQMFPDAIENELNIRELKGMGFKIYTEYALRNYESLVAYYTDILTRDGITTINDKIRRYSATGTFHATYLSLIRQRKIFRYEPDGIITADRLQRAGISPETISEFTDIVFKSVENDGYFTVYSLRKSGLETELDNFGFSDYFLSSILSTDTRLTNQQVFGKHVFCKAEKTDYFSVKDFILAVLTEYDSIDSDEFNDHLADEYGLQLTDKNKSKIISILKEPDNNFYYDGIMHKIYRDRSLYYADLDD